jgi:hypothetical protein
MDKLVCSEQYVVDNIFSSAFKTALEILTHKKVSLAYDSCDIMSKVGEKGAMKKGYM